VTAKLAVYNGALEHLGNRPLASLVEVGQPRRALDAAWDAAVAYCLEAGQWRFARRLAQLDQTPSTTPAFGFTYAFDIPDDHVRLCGVWADEALRTPLEDYREESDLWYANQSPIFIAYVSNSVSYGLDLGKWPSRFTEFVAVHLAAKTALSITGSDAKRDACITMREKQYLPNALATDVMQDPPRRFPAGSWVRARMGAAWRGSRNGQP
jgi:hypothetical protein